MPTKDRGPLFEAQREGDLFKKQIDELVGVSDKPIKDLNFPNRSVKLKELSKKCENVSSGITRLHKKVQKLTKVDEPGKVSDFEGKKEAELKRLVGLKERVDKLSNQLVPDEVEEDYLRKMKKREGAYESESVMDEDEDEEDEDEEEEEEDNDYDDEASDNPNDQGRYLGHLCTNQNNRSLTKKRRKVLTIMGYFMWRKMVLSMDFPSRNEADYDPIPRRTNLRGFSRPYHPTVSRDPIDSKKSPSSGNSPSPGNSPSSSTSRRSRVSFSSEPVGFKYRKTAMSTDGTIDPFPDHIVRPYPSQYGHTGSTKVKDDVNRIGKHTWRTSSGGVRPYPVQMDSVSPEAYLQSLPDNQPMTYEYQSPDLPDTPYPMTSTPVPGDDVQFDFESPAVNKTSPKSILKYRNWGQDLREQKYGKSEASGIKSAPTDYFSDRLEQRQGFSFQSMPGNVRPFYNPKAYEWSSRSRSSSPDKMSAKAVAGDKTSQQGSKTPRQSTTKPLGHTSTVDNNSVKSVSGRASPEKPDSKQVQQTKSTPRQPSAISPSGSTKLKDTIPQQTSPAKSATLKKSPSPAKTDSARQMQGTKSVKRDSSRSTSPTGSAKLKGGIPQQTFSAKSVSQKKSPSLSSKSGAFPKQTNQSHRVSESGFGSWLTCDLAQDSSEGYHKTIESRPSYDSIGGRMSRLDSYQACRKYLRPTGSVQFQRDYDFHSRKAVNERCSPNSAQDKSKSSFTSLTQSKSVQIKSTPNCLTSKTSLQSAEMNQSNQNKSQFYPSNPNKFQSYSSNQSGVQFYPPYDSELQSVLSNQNMTMPSAEEICIFNARDFVENSAEDLKKPKKSCRCGASVTKSEMKKCVCRNNSASPHRRVNDYQMFPTLRPHSKDAEEDGDYDDEDDEEEEEDDDDEEEYETEEEGTASDGDAMSVEVTKELEFEPVVKYEAISDYQAREKGDLSFDEGEILTLIQIRDDGWWEAENEEGERGLVPSTYLKEYSKYRDIQTEDTTQEETEFQESGNKSSRLWKTIKNAVKETSATDVLHAMGAVPSGFRPSTLSKLHSESDLYTMVNYLAPKLSTSNLAYRDLFFDPATNKIRSRPVRVQKVIQLVNCRQIPLAAAGVDVLSRYVRICLFDGSHVLSNIQVVRAMADKDQRTWTFTAKVADNSIDFAELFIRSNMTNKNVGILFELSLIYERTKTKEKSELSCGWTLLPLFQEGGIPLANKTYDQILHGGTPYEKGVEVDPSISRRVSTNPIKSLISRNKQPRMSIKVSAPSREQKEQLDTLPDVLVGSMCYLPALSFYRITLADTLLRDRPDTQSTEVIPSPFLAWFPKVAEAHDLMDALRNGWTEKLKTAKRSDKRDVEYLKELFRQTFMEYVYPLLHCSSIPPAVVGDAENERVRKEEISKIMAKKTQAQSIVAALLSQDIVFQPFEVKELSFDPIGPYCNNG